MPGGLLNIVSYGNQNVILNGNPSKTMFKCTYSKYTNFGLQKFRIDFDGARNLRLNETSKFTFKVPRYAELLMDTYLVVNLPTIWSPIVPPTLPPGDPASSTDTNNFYQETIGNYPLPGQWRPYEFKWIDNLGTQMIEKVTFSVGGQTIQEFTGQYLYNLVERDFSETKKNLYYKMTGNVPELNDPANSGARVNVYPSAYPLADPIQYPQGPEPSIRARKLYIPLNIWFTLAAKMAFPLVSLQYNELYIDIELRPVVELFVVRDVTSLDMCYQQANQNITEFQFYRFLQPPPDISLNYTDKRTNWNADIHLISTYAFLSEDEAKVFAARPQQYLIKEAYNYTFNNVTGTKKVKLESLGLISNWMWFFQRSDMYLRNQWSNYTNWPYEYLPYDLQSTFRNPKYPSIDTNDFNYPIDIHLDPSANPPVTKSYDPYINPYGQPYQFYDNTNYIRDAPSNIRVTGEYQIGNQKDIMMRWGLLLNGKYRENDFDAGVYNYIEKYVRTAGNSPDGLYCYNFGLNTSPFDFQPSGAINLSKFHNIEFEFVTFLPPLDPSAQVITICDGNGNTIGVNKPTWRLYDYNFDLTVMEERYNILTFTSGNAGLMYAR